MPNLAVNLLFLKKATKIWKYELIVPYLWCLAAGILCKSFKIYIKNLKLITILKTIISPNRKKV